MSIIQFADVALSFLPITMSNIAHTRKNGDPQTLSEHLLGVALLASGNAAKLDLALVGELLGILHDLGKYSTEFQSYLKSAVGLLNQDEDEDYVDAAQKKGKVDHSSAGAQLIWKELSGQGGLAGLVGQILALCIASHHSGLIDCLAADGEDSFSRRMSKSSRRTHLDEVIDAADKAILDRADAILKDQALIKGLQARLAKISAAQAGHNIIVQQQFGLLVRFLFSCLIDADRLDTATFEKPRANRNRMHGDYEDWQTLAARLESYLAMLTPSQPIDGLRADISRHCLDAATREAGIYKLSVPTGGGKTLASLRFALHHAAHHKMDRVIYVIPFTSIIDQNAKVVRSILEPADSPETHGRIVLEHHGNLTPEVQGWREKMLTENWDAPVIYTTNVQLLEALFGAGTRGARRMHQLANAVIVFDEIQTLPINCVHLFNNAIKFLTGQCGSTVVLCTATQPLLDKVDPQKGALRIPEGSELMPDVKGLFDQLKRIELVYDRKPGGWTNEEIATLAKSEAYRAGSCLVIVNTKASAQALYELCQVEAKTPVYHLSTSMCPAHRKEVLSDICHRLKHSEPTLCISTQLIEAGVDVDFGAVIRFVAGLDSIAQAAGRCNRNGGQKEGNVRVAGIVHVVNPKDENLGQLEAISIGRDKTERVLADYDADPAKYGNDRIGPEMMAWYYENYFFARADQMDYPVSGDAVGRADTLLNMLSGNSHATVDFANRHSGQAQLHLRQSFMTAAKAFKAIDAPTRGVIVPYGSKGRELVNDLCAAFEVEKQYDLLKRAQQYTVNVFPNILSKLEKAGAIHPIQDGTQIFHLEPRYYSPEFGLLTEPVGKMEVLYCGQSQSQHN
ncbi:MAG: CRISPR-associated helicase Cas3' [Betaproteobacteria bacterium]|nr:CRISPR-associated helicase Cas3' [Betaproteobacteria bacterium]